MDFAMMVDRYNMGAQNQYTTGGAYEFHIPRAYYIIFKNHHGYRQSHVAIAAGLYVKLLLYRKIN